MKKTQQQFLAIISLGIVILLGLWGYFHYRANYPDTEDAYVQAHVVPIASQINGEIEQVYTLDNRLAKSGDILFSIVKTPFQYAVLEAKAALEVAYQQVKVSAAAIDIIKARIEQAQANLINQEKNYHRIMSLVKSGQVAKSTGDEITANFKSARATKEALLKELSQAEHHLGEQGDKNPKVRQSQVKLDQALLNLSYTEVKAPATGYMTKFKIRPGMTIKAGQPLFYFVESQCWWIEANFKETQLQRIKPGQPVTVILDMYPKTSLKGYVDSISHGSGVVFSLLPPENATGNWVKITQRFPVKIVLYDVPKNMHLRVGASAKVTVNTKATTQKRNLACQIHAPI